MKRPLLPFVSLIAAILLLWSGCSVYVPQVASIPLMTEKNELHLNAGADIFLGLQGTVAYSPVKNIALQVHGWNSLGVTQYAQFALGTYLGDPKKVVSEIYGGYGFGGYRDEDDNYDRYYKSDYQIYYIQGNIGQTNLGSAHLDYGGSLKIGMIKGNVWDYDNYEWSNKKSERVLMEPQVFIRLGGEKLKVGFQVNAAWAYGDGEEYLSSVFIWPMNAGITLQYRFLPRKNSNAN